MPSPYRDLTDGVAHVEIEGQNVGDIITRLERNYPGFQDRVCEGAEIRHFVNIYVNSQEVRSLQGIDTELETGDEVAFVPMMAGGENRGVRSYLGSHTGSGHGSAVVGNT
jgi:MoaD family protein